MRKQYFSFIFLYIFSSCLYSQTMDDNIIINCCEDSYVFKEGPGNNPIVQNTRKTEYEASRMGATVQPHMFYGEFISLDEAKAKGVLAPKAIHRHATPENVFFDDTRICYFNLSLSRQGKKAAVQFSRTFHDLRYFTRIYFPEEYFIREKRITVTIPAALSRFRLVEKNFGPGIRCEKSVNKEGDSLFVYTLKGVPATRKEEAAPADNCLYPHLLVTGSFADVQDMYRWLNGLAEVDCTLPQAEMLTDEITAGCTDELEKIHRTYAYVQQNIRYIAFENGLAGHRPDRPAEVLRKRYGDCKGMALLLRTLLKAQGFDARMAYIGTDDIASSPDEVPTLAAINHAFCLLFHQKINSVQSHTAIITYNTASSISIRKSRRHPPRYTRPKSTGRKRRQLPDTDSSPAGCLRLYGQSQLSLSLDDGQQSPYPERHRHPRKYGRIQGIPAQSLP